MVDKSRTSARLSVSIVLKMAIILINTLSQKNSYSLDNF